MMSIVPGGSEEKEPSDDPATDDARASSSDIVRTAVDGTAASTVYVPDVTA